MATIEEVKKKMLGIMDSILGEIAGSDDAMAMAKMDLIDRLISAHNNIVDDDFVSGDDVDDDEG